MIEINDIDFRKTRSDTNQKHYLTVKRKQAYTCIVAQSKTKQLR